MESFHTKLDWKKWRTIAGLYLLTNLVFVIQRIVVDLHQGSPENIASSLIDLAGFAGIWVIFTIPLLRLTSRWPVTLGNLPVLFLFGVIFSLLHAALYLLFAMTMPGILLSAPMDTVDAYIKSFAGLGHAWRFLSFGFLIVISYAYDYYYLSRERERRATQLQLQLTEAKLDALKMQFHPHFLFNTLNAISVLIDENPTAAKRTVAQLSDLLRLALENVQTHEVPLRRELEFLDLYLLIQKTRYESRLTVRKNIDADTMNAAVPYLLLQPVVENALKYGIDKLPGPGSVTISATRQNGTLILQVDDTGPGWRSPHANNPANTSGLGLGLANVRARLLQLYGENHTFSMDDIDEGHGTRVTLGIPYKITATGGGVSDA